MRINLDYFLIFYSTIDNSDTIKLKEKNMRINLGNKAFLYPQPVLIIATFDKDNNPDAMNAAWGF